MKRLLFIATLVAMAANVWAYEYTFNWASMSANAYSNEQTVTSKPASGVDLYISTKGNVAPNVYAWEENETKLLGEWPGTKATQFKAVCPIGDENNKTGFYKIHVNSTEFRFIVSFNGSEDQSSTTVVKGNGTYFFAYDGTLHSSLNRDVTTYQEGTNNNNCNVYVQVKNSDIAPYIYAWNQWWAPKWPGFPMSQQNVMGEQWYAQNITTGSSVIFSNNGNNQTSNITPASGDNFYYYYPNGDGARYETVALMGNNANKYKEWDYTPYYTVDGNKVTFTSTGAHGTATLSIVCNNAQDVNKVKVLNGELQFPRYSHLEATVNDGYNIRQVWLGMPRQGNKNYNFEGVTACGDRPEVEGDILDLVTLWDGENGAAQKDPDHLYLVNNGTNVFTTGEVINWNESYFISDHVKVYSEGTSLEDLTFADCNVRRQNHAIDHELVGVAVKNVQGKDYLICRSAEELVNNRQTMRDDQVAFTDENGQYYEWSNPNMPQYAWIGLEVIADNGQDASSFVGKKFSGARGMYCKYETYGEATWIPWTNPFMQVNSSDLVITGEENTTLNTYSVANFVNLQDDTHFLLKPNLCELCDIVDVMRSHGDHYMYVPDENALMPEFKGENDEIFTRPNIYVELGLDYGQDYSYTSLLDNTEAYKAYYNSDVEILKGEENLGLNWRLYDKIYNFPSSLVVSAQHAKKGSYEYPLTVPNREYTKTTNENGGLVLHIIGEAVLQEYTADMFVGSSDYWSRYKYGENRNAYRNDVAFSFSRPTVDENYGTLEVWRCDNTGEKLAQIGQIVHNNPNDFNEFIITALPAAKTAQNDAALQMATTKSPYFPDNKKKALTADDNIIYLTDMFYSEGMHNKEENNQLSPEYQYRLIPSAESTYDLNSMVGYAPVYKTDENVVTRAHYTQAEVDGDVENTLSAEDKATITFTPNSSIALTEYRVYKGRLNAQAADSHKTVTKSVIEIDDRGFLNPAVEEELGETVMEFVPEVYTAYNDNTYGCYKQEVTNASINMDCSALQASQLTTADGYKYFHVDITVNTELLAVDKDSRYLVRLWRENPDGSLVLLNNSAEFGEKRVVDMNPEWSTNYSEMNESEGKAERQTFYISDTFKAPTATSSSGAPRRAPGTDLYDCKYYATLYVMDDATGKYYVKKQELPVNWSNDVATAITDLVANDAQVTNVRYINMAGVESATPFQGVNMVVTTYSNGNTTVAKVIK
ncbi:MAG: starch-binding protein [Muribaculaceae bacterium]|nr:starch-binding protein [Muribaculaceae bacterium]